MSSERRITDGRELWEAVQAAAAGDRAAWDVLWRGHHDRLLVMVRLRLDPRLRGRVDPSDVVQDAWAEAGRRLAAYAAEERPMPFRLWVWFLAAQRLLIVQRHHFTPGRDPRREQAVPRGESPGVSSVALAEELAARDTRPSEAAARREWQRAVQEALERLNPVDREVLALRHFEQLSNAECARLLGLTESGATRRYLRAVERLKHVLAPGIAPEERKRDEERTD
ncbi:MAG: sigma-70 family RNA polymerase sigma factor [Isosphaeraceae bacterium]